MQRKSFKEKLASIKCWNCKAKGCIGIAQLKGYCTVECQAKLGLYLSKKKRIADDKLFKRETKQRKKEVRKMSEWFEILQKLVNQYVTKVRDADQPCCTCGTTNDIKYDAGHFISRGASSELRFELTNIHKQCSVNCNQYGSGMRAEYNEFIINKYGQEHYEWLIGPHPLLKDQFPHWTDVEKEISRYRKLLREAGVTPCR